MQKIPNLYRKLFISTFTLSAFTFGGGYVIVPLMRKRFVEEYHWISEEEMLDIVAIAQSAPGIIAVNASILTGHRLAGVPGALLSTLATVLPPFIIISIISGMYAAFRDNAAVAAAMRAMQAGVAAVIVDAVIKMGAPFVKEKNFTAILLVVATFIASYILHINVAWVILTCGVLGALAALLKQRGKGGAS